MVVVAAAGAALAVVVEGPAIGGDPAGGDPSGIACFSVTALS